MLTVVLRDVNQDKGEGKRIFVLFLFGGVFKFILMIRLLDVKQRLRHRLSLARVPGGNAQKKNTFFIFWEEYAQILLFDFLYFTLSHPDQYSRHLFSLL